jgi:hypothetical protein
MDRVHISVDRTGALGPPWTDAGADNGHDGVLTGARPPAARLGPHRSSGGGVATGRRRWREEVTGTRWGGVPAWERRREGLGEVCGAPGVVGVAFIGPGEGAGGVAGVTAVMNSH